MKCLRGNARRWPLYLFVTVGAIALATGAAAEQKQIFGWVEKVCLSPEKMIIKAKLDSGANTASLNAIDLEAFERDGEEWVRFKVVDPEAGKKVLFERRVVRHVKIKEHGGGYQRRPVVVVKVCLGRTCRDAEMSLVNRTHFNYQILLGRRMLAGLALLDMSRTFTASPSCEGIEKD